jgi:hypothetical protein
MKCDLTKGNRLIYRVNYWYLLFKRSKCICTSGNKFPFRPAPVLFSSGVEVRIGNFFFVEKGPRSLKASCATLWWRWEKDDRFFIFPSNGAPVEWNWQGKTCPSATLSTTNPTWTESGSNPGFRGGRPATNRLSHGTAIGNFYFAFRFEIHNFFHVEIFNFFIQV